MSLRWDFILTAMLPEDRGEFTVLVGHDPTACSTWHPIEHRLCRHPWR